MPNKQLNLWRKAYPAPLYANLYGPTEITDVCTYYIVDREFDDGARFPLESPATTQISWFWMTTNSLCPQTAAA